MLAAIGLPFLLGAWVAQAQTSGLVAPMSGDCTTSVTGAVVCNRSNGVTLAPSATTDATNAANITTGTLPLAQVPALTGAKLPVGAPGTPVTYNAAGVQGPAVAPAYTANTGPIKVAPFGVSAQTSAGGATLGPSAGDTSFAYLNLANGARMIADGQVTQIRTFVNSTANATALYYVVWRVNTSGTFTMVGQSQNLLAATTAGAANTYTLTTPIAVKAGDYSGMYVAGNFSAAVNVFSGSGAYTVNVYPAWTLRNVALTPTMDFVGTTTSTIAGATSNENPIEVYEATGPVVACMTDSKGAGTPFSSDYTQASGSTGTYVFPINPDFTYSTATSTLTSLIDPSNQPCAYVQRFLGYRTANYSVPGATSAMMLANVLPSVLAAKPAVVVINTTVNEALQGVATATTQTNYASMINQLVAAGIKVIDVGAEPATSLTDAQWATMATNLTNTQASCAAAAAPGCTWVYPAVAAALGQYRPTGPVGNLYNASPAFLAADNLHWNNLGAQTMGTVLANALEPPVTVGTTVAVAHPNGGTRSRTVVPVANDGTLGWMWQDTREFLQMEPGVANAAAGVPTTGLPGQQALGCVTFLAGKGYVRCDGRFSWNLQSGTLMAANATVGTATVTTGTLTNANIVNANITNITGAVNSAIAAANAANVNAMTNSSTSGFAGFAGIQAAGSNKYNLAAFGSGFAGFGGTFGWYDIVLNKFPLQATADGRVCFGANTTAGVTTFGGATAANGCPATSGAVLYPSGIFAPQTLASLTTVSGAAVTLTSATAALPANAQVVTVNLSAAYAPTWAAPVGTPAVSLRVCENATGGYAFTPAANMKGFTGMSTAANTCTRWHAQYFSDTATWEAMSAGVSY